MLEHLFGSKTRVKLLRIFFREPERRFFVRELVRRLDVQINAVRRELFNLSQAGVITALAGDAESHDYAESDDPHEGKRKYYALNHKSMLYPELRALLLKSHVMGEESLAHQIAQGNEIRLLLFTGTFTNAETPIDMLVVGDIPQRRVAKIVTDFEHDNGCTVRYTVLTTREYEERKSLMDRFLYTVLDAPHQIIIDRVKKV